MIELIDLINDLIDLNNNEKHELSNVNVIKFDNNENKNFIFYINLDKPITYELIKKINLINNDNFTVKIIINQINQINNTDFLKLINYLELNENLNLKNILNKLTFDAEKKLIILNNLTNVEQKILEKKLDFLKESFLKYLGITIEFKTNKEIQNLIENVVENKQQAHNDINNLQHIIPLKDISINMQKINVIGEIFNYNIKKTPKVNIYTFFINDYSGTYQIKYVDFKRNNSILNCLNSLKEGDWIKAKISIIRDNFENIECGQIEQIEKIGIPEQFKRVDLSNNKRIELTVHTKMSAFDGINEIDDIFKRATDFGMTAIGFCDRYNIQSFPEIQKYAKKYNIKPIYGSEVEVIPNICKSIINESNLKLDDATYVIFDLETTGLFPIFDDIIEFGAIKVKNNKVIDKTQFFIKPNKEIPLKISQITKITNEMVVDAINQKNGIKKIIDYINDCVLIAHNGIDFDFPFLVKKAKEYLDVDLNNPVIDTLHISRALFPSWKTHRLEKLCNELQISYLSSDAHRADYDAEVLFLCWNKLVDYLKKDNIYHLNEINKLKSDKLISKYKSYMVNIYAKNNNSLKQINKLISFSLTKNFYSKPLLFKDELENNRNELIITNSPIDGEIFAIALSGTDEELKQAITFYNYIFVMPPCDCNHLIDSNTLSLKEIEIITKKIIDFAILQNKKVIAVSNSYYLDPWDKKFQYVYLYAKGIGGHRHRYYKYQQLPTTYIKTTNEMKNAFAFLNDEKIINDIVVNNSHDFNNEINNDIYPIKDKLYTPKMENVDDLIINHVYKNAKLKYGEQLPEIVQNRLKKELDSIIKNNYSVIYWISHLLVQKSYSDGYVVGSRGSVGSSLVATMLNITDVNPLLPHYVCNHCYYFETNNDVDDGFDLKPKKCPKCNNELNSDGHNIPFETFLGFKCDKVPDIDLNFSGLYQAKAHEFIRDMFGKDHAFRAGTISTIATKTAFGYVKAYFDEINSLTPSKTDLNLYVKKCENVKRTTGQHPGGILVIPNEYSIYDFCPYNYPADDTTGDWYTTHYAFEYLHDNLLKFDILGHDNPTILKMLKDLTKVDEKDIPNYDENVIKLFTSSKPLKIVNDEYFQDKNGCLTIPEFGTKFVREMLNDTKPKSFADLIRISGLSHGTNVYLDNAKSLIKNKGLHLKDTIACRDDIMIFLITKGIDSSIAFSIMEDVRKGKGLKQEYVEIMKQHNIEQWYIDSCNKIAYIFPKAHATAYVMHAWKFAWYKIYFPLEYYCVYLSIKTIVFDIETICNGPKAVLNKKQEIQERLNDKNKVNDVKKRETDLLDLYEIILEMYARGFEIKKPDILNSLANEFVIKGNTLITPFSCVDGIGSDVAESIIKARTQKPFTSINDLINRTKLNKTNVQILQNLGVLDSLPVSDQIQLFDL